MALFGDLGAANEVTRRGRALLTEIIEALRERGMVPIEADTDGVYFATPQEWSEADERALVDEIVATLPEGIRLEYESRYAAMVSHAIKNYEHVILRCISYLASEVLQLGRLIGTAGVAACVVVDARLVVSHFHAAGVP